MEAAEEANPTSEADHAPAQGDDSFSTEEQAKKWNSNLEQMKKYLAQMMIMCREERNGLACQVGP